MSGIYNDFSDAPNKIQAEGQEISVAFVRNNDGTATIKWNIPDISGCSPDQIAYDGIVITVSNKPANYRTTSPQDGVYYNGDPTLDPDLHAGDRINVARVLAALYHDKETTSITVTDVLDKVPYYISAYAVDQVGRYHREGAHAYSLPTGPEEEPQHKAGPATHDFMVDTVDGITPNSPTGLSPTEEYEFKIEINDKCLTIDGILGSTVQTYQAMANEINKRFALASDPVTGPDFPNAGVYFVDLNNKKIFLWNGQSEIEKTQFVFLDTDPTMPILGTYWYNPLTQQLVQRETGEWGSSLEFIKFNTDPSEQVPGRVWFDGTELWLFNGNTWCKTTLFLQTNNPLVPPELGFSTFWFDENEGIVYKWDVEKRKWKEVNVIVWDTDPNDIDDADFWYNLTSELVFVRVAGEWVELNNIRFEEPDEDGELSNPVANHYWFIPSEQRLLRRNGANTDWIELNPVKAHDDPTDRESCDLWWNVDELVDSLFHWDEINSVWVEVTTFVQSTIDPSLPPELPKVSYWLNPNTGVLQKITGTNCKDIDYIQSSFDPFNPPLGAIWKKSLEEWFIWDGVEYVELDVIVSTVDPFPDPIEDGFLWFNLSTNQLFIWDDGAWETVAFSLESLTPELNTLFFNTATNELFRWNGSKWVEGEAIAKVELIFNRSVCFRRGDFGGLLSSEFRDDEFGRDIVRFSTAKFGCEAEIAIDQRSQSIFSALQNPIRWLEPSRGRDDVLSGPMISHLDVGTDGSPDERRELHKIIREHLGHPSVQVELTKNQLDDCIDNALRMVRKYSSYAVDRVFFFLDTFPNQQTYLLSDRCVGFNKIVSVVECHRMRGGFFGAARGITGHGTDIFGYAALQQLYRLGTFDMLSYHMVSSYIEELRYLFADNLMFTFVPDTRMLRFHQIFYRHERILLEAYIQVPEQRLIAGSELGLWIKKWSFAEAKMKLSAVRGKYQSLPGPGGSTVLNSQELITQAENEMAQLEQQIKDMAYQNENDGVKSQFLIG